MKPLPSHIRLKQDAMLTAAVTDTEPYTVPLHPLNKFAQLAGITKNRISEDISRFRF